MNSLELKLRASRRRFEVDNKAAEEEAEKERCRQKKIKHKRGSSHDDYKDSSNLSSIDCDVNCMEYDDERNSNASSELSEPGNNDGYDENDDDCIEEDESKIPEFESQLKLEGFDIMSMITNSLLQFTGRYENWIFSDHYSKLSDKHPCTCKEFSG